MPNCTCLQFFAPLAIGSLAPLACLAQTTATGAAPTSAPPPEQAVSSVSAEIQEVVVTAQKREERLVDVPISIAAVDSRELKARQITTIEDLAQVVPDLAFNNIGANHYFEIRGVSNLVGNAPLVGIYLDEADVTLGGAAATQINPTTYDIDRVEVLRGPQGTLYGEGSAGGTIRLITRDPNLSRYEADAAVSALYTQDGEASERVNALANIPLIDGVLGVRIVGVYENDGGWIDQPAAGKKNINSQDLKNLRIKALWRIAPRLTASGMIVLSSSARGTDVSDSGNPYTFTQVFNSTATPRVRSDYDLYNFTLTYDLGGVKLLDTASYLKVSEPYENQSQVFQFTPPGTPADDYYAPIQDTRDQVLTDELRFSSTGSGPLQWTVGGFYRQYRDTTSIPLNYFGLPSGTDLPDPYAFGVTTLYNQVSGFVDVSYRLWDRLTLGAGVRDFRDHQNFTDHVALTSQGATFTSVDPRFYAQYKVTRDVNVYASAAKGFRSGGFNAENQPAYQPESVWTYEFGAKSEFLNKRLTADASLFLSDYSDYQTFGITDASTGQNFIADVGKARMKGFEGDLTYRPFDHWRFDARGDYINARFTSINASDADYNVGDPLDLVPRYQFTTSAQYDYAIGGRTGYLRLDYSQKGPEDSRNRSIGTFYYGRSNVIHTLDLINTFVMNKNLQVSVFAHNLTNDQGFTNPFNYIAAGVRSRPRTVGLEFSIPLE